MVELIILGVLILLGAVISISVSYWTRSKVRNFLLILTQIVDVNFENLAKKIKELNKEVDELKKEIKKIKEGVG